VFAQLFSAYQSAPALLDARIDVPTPKGLVVNGAGTTEIDKLVVWENTIFNPGPDQIRIRDGNVYGDVNFDDNVTVEGETHLNRTVISGGALLSSWGGNFDWGGSGNFNVSTEATFENKVTTRSDTVVEQLSHAATQSQHVCADNDGKLVLCDAEHGSQTFTAAMHFENGIFAGIKYVSDGSLGISESNNPINFIPPAGLANLFTVEVWGAGGGGAGGDSKVATNEEGSGGGGGASGAYTIATNVDLSPGAPYRATPGVGGNPGERGQCNSWGSCVSEDEATDGGNGGYSKLDRVNSNNGNYIWIEAPGGGGGNVNQNGTGSGGTPNANGGNHGGTYTQGIAGGNPGGSIDPSCRTDQYGHTETDRAGGKGASSIDGGNGGYKGSCNGLDGGNGGGGSYATGGGGGGGGSAVTTARKLHGGAGARGGFGKIKITW